MNDLPPITNVTGGSHGMAVTYEHATALADEYDKAGGQMREWAAIGGRTMADGDLLESSILSPISFARAEAAVLAATTGPDGVLVESLVWQADALTIRVEVTAIKMSDELQRQLFEGLDYMFGRVVGHTLVMLTPLALASAIAVGPQAYLIWSLLPADVRNDISKGTTDGLQEWLNQHPEILQHLINGGGGLLDGLLLPPGWPPMLPTTGAAASVLGLFYDDGTYETNRTDLTVPTSMTPPSSLKSLISHLDDVNNLSDEEHPENNGTIEVQTIRTPEGIKHVVYIPGTDDMGTKPWTDDGDIRDMGTNFDLIAGNTTGYEQGILDAMEQAGIKPGDPVTLVGHSQGGMAAVSILSNNNPGYNITNVVTVGSPTAQVDGFPEDTRVLSLENKGDVVPLLDGEDNRDSPQQVTVNFDDHETNIGNNHGLHHYVNGAEAVDASDDPSIQDQLQSLDGFFNGEVASHAVYQVVRNP